MRISKTAMGGLILTVASCVLPLPQARAGLVATDQVAAASRAQSDREKVRAFLNRADAERSLLALGVKPEFAKQRVEALTDDEVTKIAGKIDALPAGGNLGQTDIIIILLVAILVVVAI